MYIMPSTFFPAIRAAITVGFHVGDSFPETEVSGRLDRLKDPRLISWNGSASIANLGVDGKRDTGDVVAGETGEAEPRFAVSNGKPV